MNLNLDIQRFLNTKRALAYIAKMVKAAKDDTREAISRLVAVAFTPIGRTVLVVNKSHLTIKEKSELAKWGRFQLPFGYATMRYLTTGVFGKIVEAAEGVLEYTGVKTFLEEAATVLFKNGIGDLHLLGSPSFSHNAYLIGTDGEDAQAISLPSGIPAQTVRVVNVNGNPFIVGANHSHGKIWIAYAGKGQNMANIANGNAWDGRLTVFDGNTVRRLLRPNNGKISVFSADGQIIELNGSGATPNRPMFTIGAKGALGEDVAITPEAYLVPSEGQPLNTALYAASTYERVNGGNPVIGFGLYQTSGLDPAAVAQAFTKKTIGSSTARA